VPGWRSAARRRVSHPSELDILAVVTNRLIEVDDDKLEAVTALLGTRTLKATVDEALSEVLALDQRRRALLAERGVDEAMLADPEARRAAWG
jgi:Arc/MetJ family transcription regulator